MSEDQHKQRVLFLVDKMIELRNENPDKLTDEDAAAFVRLLNNRQMTSLLFNLIQLYEGGKTNER